jgi:hypothetical protein
MGMKSPKLMNLRRLFTINAIILGASGIFAVMLPERVCELYGVNSNPEVMMMSQYAGLGSLGIALVALFARKVRDPLALKGLTLAFSITHGMGMIISIQNTITGVIQLGWPIILLYSVFTIAYGYILVKGRYMK